MSKLSSNLKKGGKQLKIDKIISSTSTSAASSPIRSRSPSLGMSERSSKKSKLNEPMEIGDSPKKVHPFFDASKASSNSINCAVTGSLIDEIDKKRHNLFESITAFKFNKKRVRVLSTALDIPEDSKGILYWMSREQRVQDNWSLLYAQKLALKQNLPLHVCFCLVPNFLGATLRHYYFMLEGLKEVEQELRDLNISFHLLIGNAKDKIPEFVEQRKIGGVICDFSPLRIALNWIEDLKNKLPKDVPLAQVDGHNIVPCWVASDKLEYGARTIRNKINSKLDEFLTEFPPVIRHSYSSKIPTSTINWEECHASLACDKTVKIVDWAKPGYKNGIKILEEFIKVRIKVYDDERNDPNKDALSNLSPWYHFGQISVQRCILEVKKYASKYSKAVQGYMEEAIVRRELSDNFCYYQPNYDNLNGAWEWAKKTLNDHAKDKRSYLYTLEDLDNYRTHDKLWNAAQIQMRAEGKMHGFMRMYWAKKILEWTESPEQALQFAIYLNDRYELDGRDPSGYVGCMWSIAGIHDQGWAERAIFGKIRYMNYEGCKRKFDIERYILKYNNKKHLI